MFLGGAFTAALIVSFSSEALAAISSGASSVAVGRQFSLVLRPEGAGALAVGRNAYGQLGIGSSDDSLEPVAVVGMPDGETVVQVAAGAFHSLFLTSSGKVFAAGRNSHGQLGLGNTTTTNSSRSPVRVQLPNEAAVRAVAAGYAHSLVLTQGDEVYAFGLNSAGQLGDGTFESRSDPTLVSIPPQAPCANGARVSAIAAGYDFSLFLLNDTALGEACDGKAYATGQGLGGQLGTGLRESRNVPTRVVVEGVEAIAAGESHSLFLLKDGSLTVAGSNFDGQLGAGAGEFVATPATLALETPLAGVIAGGDSSCFVTSVEAGGALWGLGSNRAGQLGLGEPATIGEPTAIQVGSAVLQAAVGESHSLFWTMEAAVFASGLNLNGELGDGSRNSTRIPVEATHFGSAPTATATGSTTVTSTQTGTTTMAITTTHRVVPASTVTGTRTTTSKTVTRDGQAGGGLWTSDNRLWILAGVVALLGTGCLLYATQDIEQVEEVEEVEEPLEPSLELELSRPSAAPMSVGSPHEA